MNEEVVVASKWGAFVASMDSGNTLAATINDYPHRGEQGATDEMALNWLRRQQKSLRIYLNEVQRSTGHTFEVAVDGTMLVAKRTT